MILYNGMRATIQDSITRLLLTERLKLLNLQSGPSILERRTDHEYFLVVSTSAHSTLSPT